MSIFTHEFDADPGTTVDIVEIRDHIFIVRRGFGSLHGPHVSEEAAEAFAADKGWVEWEEPEDEEPIVPIEDG